MKGIKFDDKHSYYDLNLILSDCSISPATPKENYIDIPGADGSIDLTEALGDVKYNDRSGSFVFSVLPSDDFEEKKSEISNFLNGKRFKITLDKDPDYYYIGRCSVSNYKSDKMQRQITVDLILQPWKLKQTETVVEAYGNTISVGKRIILTNAKKPAVVTVTTNTAKIEFNGQTWTLGAGEHTMPEFCLSEGDNEITFYANSGDAVIFKYQEGSL